MTDAVADALAIAQKIADQVQTLLNVLGAAVYRLEEASGDLVAVATSGDLGPAFLPGLVFPRGTGIVGLVVREGHSVTTPNVLNDARVTLQTDSRVMIERAPYRSVLAVPLVVHGKVIGALSVGAAEGRMFTEAEVTVVHAFADQAAIAIENARLYRESTAHQRHLATLIEVARKLTSLLDVSAVLDTVAEAAVEVFGGEVAFRLIEGEDLVLSRATPGARHRLVRERLKVGESISGCVAATGEPIVTADVPRDSRVIAEHRVADQSGRTDALMCVPIRGGSQILGTLNIYGARGRLFDDAALSIAMSLADQAGVALQNARLYQESLEQRRGLATLVELTRRLTGRLDLVTVLGSIAEAAALLFRGEAGFRLIEDESLVRIGATAGALGAMARERLRLGEAISGWVALTGEAVVSKDTSVDPRRLADHQAALTPAQAGALMCVPIRLGDRILGTLNVYRERGFHFDDEALRLATSFADQAAIAIENARLYDEATRRRREAETLARIGVTLTESLDVSTVSQQIVDSARDLLGTRNSALRLLESDGSLRGVAFGGATRQTLQPGHLLPAGIGIVALAIATGRPVESRDWQTDPTLTLTEELRQTYQRTGVSSLLAVPLRVQGNIIGALTVGDVAGRTFSETEIALLQTFADQAAVAVENARLYREALEAYQRLSETQAQLLQSQKMEAIGRLAGGIAHDFNNLLTIIQGRSEMLLRRLPASDESRRDISAISRTAERAATLTRQLLAFSRRQTLQPTVLDLNAVVSGIHEMLRQLIGEDIDLEVVLDRDAGTVMADRGQLEQVMVNLTVNARDAMPTGGRLVIETGNAVVDEAFAHQSLGASTGPHVFFRVSDKGAGIDPAIQASIFEPFFTTKGLGQGTGLGLSTVDGIVKQHGGFITVRSAPGQGATFTVYLPRSVDRAEAVGEAKWCGDLRRGTETILLVEDEGELRALAQEILEDAGFTVLAAANGAAALKIARQREGSIDLLLTDVVMPRMSGTDLAGEVRRTHPDVRVLYMSGYPAHPSGRTEPLGVDAPLVEKPFTPEALTGMVRRTLDADRAEGFSPDRP